MHDARSTPGRPERLIDALSAAPLATTAVLVALAYYAGAELGMRLAFAPLKTSVLWPPNSILTAALLLVPVRHWWICLAAALPVHVARELQAGYSAPLVTLLFVTNCSEGLIAASGIRLFSDSPTQFNTFRRVLVFVLSAGFAAPVLSSFADAAVKHVISGAAYWDVWSLRTFGNILTELSVVPVIVGAFDLVQRRRLITPRRVVEGAVLGLTLLCTAVWIFGEWTTLPIIPRTPSVLLIPFLLWAGVRFGVSGVSAGLFLSAFVASYEASLGHRPFSSVRGPLESLMALQIYLAVMGVPMMLIAGLLNERRRGAADLADRLRFEALLSAVAGAFVHMPRHAKSSAFDEGLRRIGEFFGLDYVGLLEHVRRDGPLEVSRQWTPPGGPSSLANVKCVEAFPWVFGRVLAGETLIVESIDQIPAAAAIDHASFQSFGLQSAVLLPLVSGERLLGVLSVVTVEGRTWAAEDMAQLRVVAEVLANACARRQAEHEVESARRELAHLARQSSMGELTASLAHQLNQPLTSILNNAEAARRFLDSGEASLDELRDIVTDIIDDDQRAGNVIRRVREMLTRTTRPPVRLDANALVRDVGTLIASDAVMRNVAVSFEIAPRPLAITGNRTDLEQVLLNVVTNAMDAVADLPVAERRVKVGTALDGVGRAVITVRDQGQGFEPGTEHKIFEPFFTSKAAGMGMGLTVARTLVDQHGGSISAANQPGGGAVVTIAIPVADPVA